MDKAQRHKMVRTEFPEELHAKGENGEFKAFASTGMAAKIGNLQSVYIMYLNTIDRQKD